MTNLETAKSTIASNYPFDDDAYAASLTLVGLDPSAETVPGKGFDIAVAQMILFLITSADVSEGGYAVKLDRDAMFRVRQALLDKWDSGIPAGPILKDRTYKW